MNSVVCVYGVHMPHSIIKKIGGLLCVCVRVLDYNEQ